MVRYNINHFTFNLITASTASFAKYSLSCDRILELKVVIAIFIKSDLNFSALLTIIDINARKCIMKSAIKS